MLNPFKFNASRLTYSTSTLYQFSTLLFAQTFDEKKIAKMSNQTERQVKWSKHNKNSNDDDDED